jgi:YwiC-like protein
MAELGRPIVPKEHGAWAVLYGSLLVGLGVAGHFTLPVLLFLLGVTACAFANGPLALLVRPAGGPGQVARRRQALFWILIYGAVAVATLVPLVTVFRMTFLLPFGMGAVFFVVVRAYQLRERDDRTLGGALTGMAGITLAAPAAHAVAVGAAQPAGAMLWGLCFLFFWSGIFYVRMRVQGMLVVRQGGPARSNPARLPCILYHALLLVAMPLLALWEVVPWAVLVAFAPAIWRAGVGLRHHEARLELRRLGWSEVVLTSTFILLLIGAFRLGSPLG